MNCEISIPYVNHELLTLVCGDFSSNLDIYYIEFFVASSLLLVKIVFLMGRIKTRFINLLYYPGSQEPSGRASELAIGMPYMGLLQMSTHSFPLCFH